MFTFVLRVFHVDSCRALCSRVFQSFKQCDCLGKRELICAANRAFVCLARVDVLSFFSSS